MVLSEIFMPRPEKLGHFMGHFWAKTGKPDTFEVFQSEGFCRFVDLLAKNMGQFSVLAHKVAQDQTKSR